MYCNSAAVHHADKVLGIVDNGQRAGSSGIAASWCRSALRHGLDPRSETRPERCDDSNLARLLDCNGDLMAAAEPVLASLFKAVRGAGCCVILAGVDGVVLGMRSSAADDALFGEISLKPGANWSEAAEGTNGIGTCLVEQRPVIIHQEEHFASRNIGVSCIDAPVFGPGGELIAALDISTARSDAAQTIVPLGTSLVQEAARQIERNYFCRRYSAARIIYVPDDLGRGSALLAVDKDDLLIGATRAARHMYNISQTQLNAPAPVADVLGLEQPTQFADSDRMILRQALARARGNVSTAARALGIGRATFYRRMERVGLTPDSLARQNSSNPQTLEAPYG